MSVGYINSFQSLGTVDGPGVRLVVFLQGCNLRCKCCHNPDTWSIFGDARAYDAKTVVDKAKRFTQYFKDKGGITLSGGEPLLQGEFAGEVFALCKQSGINTCLDTSGSIINSFTLPLLKYTDRVLLDIKYTDDKLYKENVGCSLKLPLEFLKVLEENRIPTVLRQVIIPGINDTDENAAKLLEIAQSHSCVDKIELLPFRKICQSKYDAMNIPFPFADLPTPTAEAMAKLNAKIAEYI